MITQLAFCFTTVPFVLLSLPDSLLVWARVYFYTIIGVVLGMAFFASPAKPWLIKQLNEKRKPALQRTASQESLKEPVMGMPHDPAQDFDEVFQELRDGVEKRRRNKSERRSVSVGQDLKGLLSETTGKVT